jgi:hypothetical protein
MAHQPAPVRRDSVIEEVERNVSNLMAHLAESDHLLVNCRPTSAKSFLTIPVPRWAICHRPLHECADVM